MTFYPQHDEGCSGADCTYADCDCGRGRYLPCRYQSCYECYLDRRDGYISCIFCGRWHSEAFDCCFKCRPGAQGRDEAAAALRLLITQRDNFECRACGIRAGEPQWSEAIDESRPAAMQVDHIVPCAKGGTADEWNLRLLCALCNRRKADAWWVGCPFEDQRTALVRQYFLVARSYFNAEALERFQADVEAWRATGTWDPLAHKQWREHGIGGPEENPLVTRWVNRKRAAVPLHRVIAAEELSAVDT